MIRVEVWRSSVLKWDCVGNTYFKLRSLHKYTRLARVQDRVEVKEHDRSGAGEEGYAVIYAGCKGSERKGTRLLRLPCCTV